MTSLTHTYVIDNIYVHYLPFYQSLDVLIDNRKSTKIISGFELDSLHKKACPCGGPLR